MKKKTKTIGVLLTGIALAVGIAVSGGVIHNSHVVDETLAATTYSHTITTQTWSSYGVQKLSGIDWTASATGVIIGVMTLQKGNNSVLKIVPRNH